MRESRNLFTATFAALMLALVATSNASAATRYVDDDWAGFASGTSVTIGAVNATIGTNAYATVSAAITAATAGDIIQVGPGTYSELVVVNKSVELRGAQYGVAATGSARSGGESLLQGTGGSSSYNVHVQANDVVIDGFAINMRINPTNASLFARDGINVRIDHVAKPGDPSIGAYRTGVAIRNNWIYSNIGALTGQQQGITFGESPNNNAPSAPLNAECANVTISGNYMQVLNTAASGGPRGVVLGNQFQGTISAGVVAFLQYSNFTITNNTFIASNTPFFQSQLRTKLNNMIITGNTFKGARSGVSIAATMTNSDFSSNLIEDISAGSGATLCLVNSTANNNTIRRIGGSSGLVISGGKTGDQTFFQSSTNSSLSGNSITYNDVTLAAGNTYIAGLNIQPGLDAGAASVAGTLGVDAATITLAGNTFVNGGLTSAVPAVAIAQRSFGATLNPVNASANVFNGLSLSSSSSDADLFSIADQVADAIDASNMGRVALKAGHQYATPNSFWAPLSTTAPSAQRALDGLLAGHTAHFKTGAYGAGGAGTLNVDATIDAQAGATGLAISLGSANAVTLAGAGDVNATGNANGNTMAGNSGINALAGGAGADALAGGAGNDAIDGGAGIDQATFAGSIAGAISGSSTLTVATAADGSDSVVNTEKLVFSDATVLIVGIAGSEYTTLNAALAAGAGLKAEETSAAAVALPYLYGTLVIDPSTPFASAADLAAIIARFAPGSTITVTSAGMSSTQLAAVGANAASLPVNSVSAQSPATCLSSAHPTVSVPVNFSNLDLASVRSASVVVRLSSNLSLAGAIAEGGYFNSLPGGSTFFQAVNEGGGLYTVDVSLLGLPCGQTAASGTLFTLSLQSSAAGATDSVSIVSVDLRDCNNGSVLAFAGSTAIITVDNVNPVAVSNLAAAQVKSGNDADGTTKVTLSFTAPVDAAVVEVYRAGYGSYPEYDDASGAVPATPSYPPAAPWALTAVTASGQTDEPSSRDFYYYVVFTKDACGNISAVSNKTSGTLNYHLGDVATPLNNQVNTADISLLGANYGVTITNGDSRNVLDVGPTTDRSVNARPTTDNKIGFDDLMMFAINYGVVSAPSTRPVAQAASDNTIALDVPQMPAVGQTFDVAVNLAAAGDMQGLTLDLNWNDAIVEPIAVEAGELLDRQPGQTMALSARPGNVDVAVFGQDLALVGEGRAAIVRFRVKAAGDAAIALRSAEGRGTDNRVIALNAAASTPPKSAPARSGLAFVGPNPASGKHTLSMALAKAGVVELSIYSVDGRRVKTLAQGAYAAGTYPMVWDGRDDNGSLASPGLYWARLKTPEGGFNRTVVRIQ